MAMRVTWLIALLILLFHVQTSACSRPIRVAAAPAGSSIFFTPQKQVAGSLPDLLARVAELTPCRFDYVPMPVNRGFLMLQQGGIDLVPMGVRTAERDLVGEFVATSQSPVMLIHLKSTPVPYRSLKELRDAQAITINVVRGHRFGPRYDAWLADPRTRQHLEEVTTTDMIAGKMLAGRATAIVIPLAGFAESAKRYQMADKIAYTPLSDIAPVRFGIYLSRTSLPAADRQLLTSTLQRLVDAGEYQRMLSHYYPAWILESLSPPDKLDDDK
jgi:polar amino acid transport system substrate-binding protein